MKVAELMTTRFEIVRESDTLLHAMRRLRDSPGVEDEIGIKCVIVLNARDGLAGILTQSDVVGEILFPYFVRDLADRATGTPAIREEDYRSLGAWAAKVKVKDVMSRGPITIGPAAGLFEAADAIVSKKVKSLPVVEGGKVIGIVYRSTLYRRIAEAILQRTHKEASA